LRPPSRSARNGFNYVSTSKKAKTDLRVAHEQAQRLLPGCQSAHTRASVWIRFAFCRRRSCFMMSRAMRRSSTSSLRWSCGSNPAVPYRAVAAVASLALLTRSPCHAIPPFCSASHPELSATGSCIKSTRHVPHAAPHFSQAMRTSVARAGTCSAPRVGGFDRSRKHNRYQGLVKVRGVGVLPAAGYEREGVGRPLAPARRYMAFRLAGRVLALPTLSLVTSDVLSVPRGNRVNLDYPF
jgi:hypothetical protein